MPLGRQSHRHHRTHGSKHKKREKVKGAVQEEGKDNLTYDTPSQRVQFILGTEDDDEHVPHELFTELDEICVRGGEDAEWKETARWLKFEEDVEDGGDRWSKPYVATLSLHSLFELRSCIINGTVLLDMRANSIQEIADMILDHQESSMELDENIRVKVREALLKRHHHQIERKRNNLIPIVRSFAEVGKKQSEPYSMDKAGQMLSPQSLPTHLEAKNGVNQDNVNFESGKVDLHFMKKIPTGAEASNVLVGELDFLKRPIVAFVRLSPAILLTGLTEVPIPTSSASNMAVGKNKRLIKGGKKGAKKKIMDPFSKKDWYDVKAPAMFDIKNLGKTLVTGTQGTKIASEGLKGHVFELICRTMK
ncbi:electroneutral sodium bicarbonate exchanger 1-like isoform X5 [Chiloscyllium plagiosum]|uniref:electroneutral sodium bicarbonate exchanger 1-like isoform X5 n=1 Tax=Chiloscyllium plagiosum TaxID=36176 RepID=UPI001CB818A7|nr:electroneutral sodium bicarbonate exchanger 1-like isoform X5 [Chiloscyllium plagiosum]